VQDPTTTWVFLALPSLAWIPQQALEPVSGCGFAGPGRSFAMASAPLLLPFFPGVYVVAPYT